MSTHTEVVVYPLSYDSARLSLLLFALYGVGTSLVGILFPDLLMKILYPALHLIHKTTGLVHTIFSWKYISSQGILASSTCSYNSTRIYDQHLLIHVQHGNRVDLLYLQWSPLAPRWSCFRGGRVSSLGAGCCHISPVLHAFRLWTRLMYISASYWFCFFTPYGSSLLFLVATNDIISVLLTKWIIGKSWIELVRSGAKIVSVPTESLKN